MTLSRPFLLFLLAGGIAALANILSRMLYSHWMPFTRRSSPPTSPAWSPPSCDPLVGVFRQPDLPASILAKFRALNNIAVVCVIVKLRRPVSANFWVNTNDPDMDIPGIVEYTNLRPMDAHIVYVPFYMPGEHERYGDSDDVFAGKVRRYLCMINPQLGADDFIDVRVSRYRHAQPICEPGFLDRLPPRRLPDLAGFHRAPPAAMAGRGRAAPGDRPRGGRGGASGVQLLRPKYLSFR